MLWSSLVQLPTVPAPRPAATRRFIRQWGGDPGLSPFSLPKPDPCLFTAFSAYAATSKPWTDFASSSISSSGAAGHAVASAAVAAEVVVTAFRQHASDPQWASFFTPLADKIEKEISTPLYQASSILASSFRRGVDVVRQQVVRSASPAVQPALKSIPSSSEFFFGNPVDVLSASMSYAIMEAQLAAPPAASRRAQQPNRNPADPSSSSTPRPSSPSAPVSGGRSSGRGRGGGGGGKKSA